ncbi:hypothetical protein ABPG75_002676 [Micractinium tetrahymenae]
MALNETSCGGESSSDLHPIAQAPFSRDRPRMLPVHGRGGARRSRWPSRTGLLAALLLFTALQVAVIITYYKSISASRERGHPQSGGAVTEDSGDAADTRRLGGSATGRVQAGGTTGTVVASPVASAIAAKATVTRRLTSRKEEAKALLQTEQYDERRVLRLRTLLDAAAARLESAGPLPLAATTVFPPGKFPTYRLQVWPWRGLAASAACRLSAPLPARHPVAGLPVCPSHSSRRACLPVCHTAARPRACPPACRLPARLPVCLLAERCMWQKLGLRRLPGADIGIFFAGNEDRPCIGKGPPSSGVVAAVVLVTFNRARYLEQTLASLFKVHGADPANRRKFLLFVSQDFNATGVQDVVEQHLDKLSYLQHYEEREPVTERKKEPVVYYRIANHYKFILKTMFDCFGFQRVIILEDDMMLAPDFFSYFESTASLLDNDPTLYCISSWNDHGQDRFVRNATQLYRSDFFPGLGWMLNRRIWDQVVHKWPRAYWDDYMRLNSTRQGRQCIRPEICRTYNFGDIGSSSGQYFRLFLKPIRLNNEMVDWMRIDLGYLQADRYRQLFEEELHAAQELGTVDEAQGAEPGRDYVLRYSSQQHYEKITGRLRMLREWRDGVPRGAYHGVVAVRNAKGARIFVAPTADVDFNAPVVVPPGMELRVDSTGALVRRRARTPAGGLSASEWLKQRKERLAQQVAQPQLQQQQGARQQTQGQQQQGARQQTQGQQQQGSRQQTQEQQQHRMGQEHQAELQQQEEQTHGVQDSRH